MFDLFILSGFLIILASFIYGIIICYRRLCEYWYKALFWCGILLSAIVSFLLTYRYTYMPDIKTRVHGWPIPLVIWQQDETGKWLDYVGYTVIFAWPLNFIILTMAFSLFWLIYPIGVSIYRRIKASRVEIL